jgi:hypothetical protein
MTYYKIHSAPLVYDEMNESVLWYNKQATLLGGHFLKQISNSIGLISQFPHVTNLDVRRWTLDVGGRSN